MELSIRITASDVAESQRETMQNFIAGVVYELEQHGISAMSATVLADRVVLKQDGDLELSKLAGTYTIHKGIRTVGEFYDKGMARTVYDLLRPKGGKDDQRAEVA
jgi:hypothetical protein